MLNGELRQRTVWTVSLVAGGFILAGSITARAADLGGNCCADLEERIAELEATTDRKGNRKVSLSVYGKVNQAVMFWDDGVEDNAYVVTNDSSRTRIGFKGKAKISSDWSAYYKIEFGIRTANSKRSNQFDPTASNRQPDIRHTEWGLKSKTWGKFGVGLQKNITKDITKSNVAGTGDVGKYSDAEDYGGGFFLVAKGSNGAFTDGTQWRRLIARTGAAPGEGDRIESVTYYTPSWHGIQIGAVWGGDDAGGIGALYKNTFGSVKVKAGIAYQQNTSDQDRSDLHGCPGRNADSGSPIPNVSDADCDAVGGSIAIMDTHHGLYAQFAAGKMWDDTVRAHSNFIGTNVDNEYWFWAMEAGIQRKWHPLGATTLFGQYYKYEGGGINQTIEAGDPINTFGDDAKIFSSEVQFWGLGIMQKIDAAEMKLYSLYRHYEFDLMLADGGAVQASAPLEDFQVLMSGAVIYF